MGRKQVGSSGAALRRRGIICKLAIFILYTPGLVDILYRGGRCPDLKVTNKEPVTWHNGGCRKSEQATVFGDPNAAANAPDKYLFYEYCAGIYKNMYGQTYRQVIGSA